MRMTKEETAKYLTSLDNILIIAHENPDGDAVGSACGLCIGLRQLGKTAFVALEGCPKADEYIYNPLKAQESFEYDYIVAVDTADRRILGSGAYGLSKECSIDLCIDHHMSNTFFADKTCLDDKAAAAAQVIYDILCIMGVSITADIAQCLYIGISTDTGCFRFSNTTAETLFAAAKLVEAGADIAGINKAHFETKTKEYAALEQLAVASMEMHLDGKCAIICITNDMFINTGALDSETQPLSALPRQIEGVLAGVTMKEKQPGLFRISVRTNEPANASDIAASLGGGGHKMAAGCSFEGTADEAKRAILDAVAKELSRI